MSITRPVRDSGRTWLLIAGLTALFVGLGDLVGGGGLLALRRHRRRLQPRHVLVLGQARAQGEQGRAASTERGARALPRRRELAGRAGVPMPRVYLIPSEQPNAFATGRSPKNAAVAVTEGLLRYLPRDQVRGVLAHELAHVENRDILVTTIAAMIGAAIAAIANILQFSMLFGGDDDDTARSASSARSPRSSSRRSPR